MTLRCCFCGGLEVLLFLLLTSLLSAVSPRFRRWRDGRRRERERCECGSKDCVVEIRPRPDPFQDWTRAGYRRKRPKGRKGRKRR